MPYLYRPSLLLEDFLSGLVPVREKGGKSFIGQRMGKHLLQNLGRQGGDVGTHLRSLDDMDRVAHGSDQHLGRSEEHTSELQSLMRISYAVFCLKKKNA